MSENTELSRQAYELALPGGPVMRGIRWGRGTEHVLFLHEPGEDRDLDAWGHLPAQLAAALRVMVTVFDLPGHGLSDDPWDENLLPGIFKELYEIRVHGGLVGAGPHPLTPSPVEPGEGEVVGILDARAPSVQPDSVLLARGEPGQPLLVVSAGVSASAALIAAAGLDVAGVVGLSPVSLGSEMPLPRTPTTSKLIFAGAQAGDDLAMSRSLAATVGGWAVVTSIPTETRGTNMLATEWSPRISEHVVAFARDVLFRSPPTAPPRQ